MNNLFQRHLVRDYENQTVTFSGGDQGEAQAGVAGSRFNDGSTRFQFFLLLRGFDHGQRHSIFDRAGWILIFQLDEQAALASIEPGAFHERSIPD